MSEYTLKDVIDQFVVPQVNEIKQRQSSVEHTLGEMLQTGSPWGREQVESVLHQVEELDRKIDDVVDRILTPDGVNNLIAQALKENRATGLTIRERRLRYLAVGVSAGVFLLQVVSFIVFYKTGHG